MSEELLGNLAWLMEVVPECEGALALDKDGNLIGGQTILERDLPAIASRIQALLKASEFNDLLEKGKPIEVIISWEAGFMVVMTDGEKTVGAMLGEEDRLQLSALSRRLKQIFGYP
jgi:predicted regulator of Ras-like GTPase activity (Roadblock/LC7/MglB family)